MFTSEREGKIDRRTGAAAAVVRTLYRSVVVKRESKSEALDLLDDLHPNPHPRGSDRKFKTQQTGRHNFVCVVGASWSMPNAVI